MTEQQRQTTVELRDVDEEGYVKVRADLLAKLIVGGVDDCTDIINALQLSLILRWINGIAYYEGGLFHREDGPAIECLSSGRKDFYVHGCSPTSGPITTWPDGCCVYEDESRAGARYRVVCADGTTLYARDFPPHPHDSRNCVYFSEAGGEE